MASSYDATQIEQPDPNDERINVSCSMCQDAYSVDMGLAGKKICCRTCKDPIYVPDVFRKHIAERTEAKAEKVSDASLKKKKLLAFVAASVAFILLVCSLPLFLASSEKAPRKNEPYVPSTSYGPTVYLPSPKESNDSLRFRIERMRREIDELQAEHKEKEKRWSSSERGVQLLLQLQQELQVKRNELKELEDRLQRQLASP